MIKWIVCFAISFIIVVSLHSTVIKIIQPKMEKIVERLLEWSK